MHKRLGGHHIQSERVGDVKILDPTGVSNQAFGCPTRSQFLYRLRLRSSVLTQGLPVNTSFSPKLENKINVNELFYIYIYISTFMALTSLSFVRNRFCKVRADSTGLILK
jgi:hypothetical protein